jgi:hypothetical protein
LSDTIVPRTIQAPVRSSAPRQRTIVPALHLQTREVAHEAADHDGAALHSHADFETCSAADQNRPVPHAERLPR